MFPSIIVPASSSYTTCNLLIALYPLSISSSVTTDLPLKPPEITKKLVYTVYLMILYNSRKCV